MTLSTQNNKSEHLGNGVTTVFAYDFLVLDESHMKVYVGGNLANPAIYTVSGIGNPSGGDVTFVTAPLDQVTVVLYRDVPVTQSVDYQPYDPFPSETHEGALDKLTMICQQLTEGLSRTNQDPIGGEPLQEEFPLGTILFFQTAAGALPGNWTLKDIGDVVLGVSNGSDQLYAGANPGGIGGSWTLTVSGNTDSGNAPHNHQTKDGKNNVYDSGGVSVAIDALGGSSGGPAVTVGVTGGNPVFSNNSWWSADDNAAHLHSVTLITTAYRPQAATGVLAEKTSLVAP